MSSGTITKSFGEVVMRSLPSLLDRSPQSSLGPLFNHLRRRGKPDMSDLHLELHIGSSLYEVLREAAYPWIEHLSAYFWMTRYILLERKDGAAFESFGESQARG